MRLRLYNTYAMLDGFPYTVGEGLRLTVADVIPSRGHVLSLVHNLGVRRCLGKVTSQHASPRSRRSEARFLDEDAPMPKDRRSIPDTSGV